MACVLRWALTSSQSCKGRLEAHVSEHPSPCDAKRPMHGSRRVCWSWRRMHSHACMEWGRRPLERRPCMRHPRPRLTCCWCSLKSRAFCRLGPTRRPRCSSAPAGVRIARMQGEGGGWGIPEPRFEHLAKRTTWVRLVVALMRTHGGGNADMGAGCGGQSTRSRHTHLGGNSCHRGVRAATSHKRHVPRPCG